MKLFLPILWWVLICLPNCLPRAQIVQEAIVNTPIPASSGSSVTVALGATQVNSAFPDGGNALEAFITPFMTPATMTSPSWQNLNVYFTSPDSSTPAWGAAIYSNTVVSGTVTTVGTAVTWSSGTVFSSEWQLGVSLGSKITINGIDYFIATVNSSVSITLTASAGTQATPVAYTINTPNALLCGYYSGAVATSGFGNSLSATNGACGAPTTSTLYWLASITASSSQAAGTYTAGNTPCPSVNQGIWKGNLASFTSSSSWPSTMSGFTTPNMDGADGCVASYANVSYTTTATGTVAVLGVMSCDSTGTTCVMQIPATGTSHTMLVWEAAGTKIPAAPSDVAGDTFTKIGSCPTVTGGSEYTTSCFYYASSLSSGQTAITCNFSGLDKQSCWSMEIVGGGAIDKNSYDTAVTSSNPFTGTATSTTTQAAELLIGFAVQAAGQSGSGPTWNMVSYNAGGSWSLLATAGGAGNSPVPFALFFQNTTVTGAYAVTATLQNPAGALSLQNYTGLVTIK